MTVVSDIVEDGDGCAGDGEAWKMQQMFNVGTFPYGTLRHVCDVIRASL